MYSKEALKNILEDLKAGELSLEKTLERLKNLPYETLPFAKLDHHRTLRKGFPEAIYSPGKSLDQLKKIIQSMKKSDTGLLLTRLEKNDFTRLKKIFPDLKYSNEGKVAYINKRSRDSGPKSSVAVITAGTSDIPVAEEAAITLEIIGKNVIRIYDCGVAGLHRLLDKINTLREVKAIICVAGMEGALASVIAGVSDKPVIAVPTSVGYGASFEGIAPLLTMLNSCAQGIACVNIDNGFGAACFCSMIT